MILKPFNILYIKNEVEEFYFRYQDISVFHFYDFKAQIELYIKSGETFRFNIETEAEYLTLKQEIIKHLSAEEE